MPQHGQRIEVILHCDQVVEINDYQDLIKADGWFRLDKWKRLDEAVLYNEGCNQILSGTWAKYFDMEVCLEKVGCISGKKVPSWTVDWSLSEQEYKLFYENRDILLGCSCHYKKCYRLKRHASVYKQVKYFKEQGMMRECQVGDFFDYIRMLAYINDHVESAAFGHDLKCSSSCSQKTSRSAMTISRQSLLWYRKR